VPGSTGGSVHVEEVARGLTSLGHEVHVVALPGDGPTDLKLHRSPMLIEHRLFRWTAQRGIMRLLDERSIDCVMERYYNFGGEGIRGAYERGVPSLLEVNSPLVEPPGSRKDVLDQVAIFRPMERWRNEICQKATALVTPLPDIVPESVPRDKVHKVNWGANVEKFRPDIERRKLGIPLGRRVVLFSGSFRPWHGADLLVRAAARVLQGPLAEEAFFLFVGQGPAWREARRLAAELGVNDKCRFLGAVPYEDMPSHLANADIGVAPYQPSRLDQMRLGFYWSPLKVFEYMAMGLPVVTLDVAPLREIVRPGKEGLLFEEGDAESLCRALVTLLNDPDRSRKMGRAARHRVEAHFSWRRHCEQLEGILRTMVETR
jgi:starch synthase